VDFESSATSPPSSRPRPSASDSCSPPGCAPGCACRSGSRGRCAGVFELPPREPAPLRPGGREVRAVGSPIASLCRCRSPAVRGGAHRTEAQERCAAPRGHGRDAGRELVARTQPAWSATRARGGAPALGRTRRGLRDNRAHHRRNPYRQRGLSRLVHQGSPREGRAFVAINCAALPEQLLESSSFGHEKGAFTAPSPPRSAGSSRPRAGRCSWTRSAR